ncbi:MAG: hypothetical protein ACKVP3_10550 [Hyphomicrobiaceae bacterium]
MPTSQAQIPMRNARRGDIGRGLRYVLAFGLALAACAVILVPFVAH